MKVQRCGVILGLIFSIQFTFGKLSESFQDNVSDSGVLVDANSSVIKIRLEDKIYELQLDPWNDKLELSYKTKLAGNPRPDIRIINNGSSCFDISLLNRSINFRCCYFDTNWYVTLFSTNYNGKLALTADYVGTDKFVAVKDLLIGAKRNVFINKGQLAIKNSKIFSERIVNQSLITSKFEQYLSNNASRRPSVFASAQDYVNLFSSTNYDKGFYNLGELDIDNVRTEDLKVNLQGNINVKSWVSDRQVRLGRDLKNSEYEQNSKTDYCCFNELNAPFVSVDALEINKDPKGYVSSVSSIWKNFYINKINPETPIFAMSNELYTPVNQTTANNMVDSFLNETSLHFEKNDGYCLACGHVFLRDLIKDESYEQRPMEYWVDLRMSKWNTPHKHHLEKARVIFMDSRFGDVFYYNERGERYSGFSMPSTILSNDFRKLFPDNIDEADNQLNTLVNKLWDTDLSPFMFSKICKYEDIERELERIRLTLVKRLESSNNLSDEDEVIKKLIKKYIAISRRKFDMDSKEIDSFRIKYDIKKFYDQNLPQNSKLKNEFELWRKYWLLRKKSKKDLQKIKESLVRIFNIVGDDDYTSMEEVISTLKSTKFHNDIKQKIIDLVKKQPRRNIFSIFHDEGFDFPRFKRLMPY